MRVAPLLALALLCACSGERNPPESTKRIIDAPTADLRPSSIGFHVGGRGGEISYPAPWSIQFVDPLTRLEPVARDSNGTPTGIVVVLSDLQLHQLRGLVNEIGAFGAVSRFTSIRSPGTEVPAPEYPPIQQRLAGRYDCALELRATSIYRDAHYIDEFATIESRFDAEAFLEKLASRIQDENSRKGLLQIRDSLRRGKPSKPAAGNATISAHLAIGHYWPGLGEPGRWTT